MVWLVGNVRFYLSDHDPFKILRVELMAPKVTCIFPLPYFPVAPFVCCSQSRGPFQKQLERRKSPNKVRQPHKIYLTTATLTWILFGHVTNSSRLDASLSFSLLPHYLFHLAPTSQPATRPATRPTDRPTQVDSIKTHMRTCRLLLCSDCPFCFLWFWSELIPTECCASLRQAMDDGISNKIESKNKLR